MYYANQFRKLDILPVNSLVCVYIILFGQSRKRILDFYTRIFFSKTVYNKSSHYHRSVFFSASRIIKNTFIVPGIYAHRIRP